MKADHIDELEVYQNAFQLQQQIFRQSKRWPREENYSLTDQIRRASRSVGANISEAWAKRRYPAHFLSKLTDADGELAETRHWIKTATDCGYLSLEECEALRQLADLVGRRLGTMIQKHDQFCQPAAPARHGSQ